MAKKKRKKYVRPYPNNPKKDIMDKKIPIGYCFSRKVHLEFARVCKDELQLSKHNVLEQLAIAFIEDFNKEKRNQEFKLPMQ